MAAQNNSCPFMAMELTKLKYLNDKEKKENLSLPVLPSTLQSLPKTIFYRKKGSAHSLSVSECVALKKKREIWKKNVNKGKQILT